MRRREVLATVVECFFVVEVFGLEEELALAGASALLADSEGVSVVTAMALRISSLGAGGSLAAEAILAGGGTLTAGDSLGVDTTLGGGVSWVIGVTTLGAGDFLTFGDSLDAGVSLVTDATTLGAGDSLTAGVILAGAVSFTAGVSLITGGGGGVTLASTGRSGSTGSRPGVGPYP